MNISSSAALYYSVQGAAVILWWLALWLYPDAREYFKFEDHSQVSLLAFWAADLLFIAVGSYATAYPIRWRGARVYIAPRAEHRFKEPSD